MELAGKLLIASPGMGDPRFDRCVIFLCAYSSEGAMGLMINRPIPGLGFADLLGQLDIALQGDGDSAPVRVRFGGPVEQGRGFVLHSPEYAGPEGTLHVDHRFSMTATVDVLAAMAAGQGPERVLLALGYAGWGPGQLEDEIGQNGWLTCEATPDLVFSEDDGSKWERALQSLGIDVLALSATAGRA